MFETLLLKQLSFLIGSWNYILSIALCSFMMGMGIGALLALNRKIHISFSLLAALQGVAVIISSFMLLRLDIILAISSNLFFIGIILSPTFILFGYLFSSVLTWIRKELPEAIRFIYSADLIGAALGGLVSAFIILPLAGINKASILCTILFFCSSILFSGKEGLRRLKKAYLAIGALILLMIFDIDPLIERNRNIKSTPLYTMLDAGARLLYTGWSPLQRIDLVQMETILVVTYDGQPWTSFEPRLDYNSVDSLTKGLGLRFFRGFYPFTHKPEKILIVGVGAGADIAYALTWADEWKRKDPDYNAEITGVEIDPLIIDLLKNEFSIWNRNTFKDQRVEIVKDDGRHFLENTTKKYDLINFPNVDTPFAFTSPYGFNPYLRAENYLYTLEGLRTAYQRLSENGVLVISVGNWFNESFEELNISEKIKGVILRERRLISTLKAILKEEGVDNWQDHLEVSAYKLPHIGHSMVEVVIKATKRPIDPDVIKNILSHHHFNNPHYVFGKSDMEDLSSLYMPATDDQPFYYNFPLTAIPEVVSRPLFFSLILLVNYLFLGLVSVKIKGVYNNLGVSLLLFIYFGCIGISYIITELFYVQKSIMILNNSFLGTAAVVPLFLLFSGIGSMLVIRLYSRFGAGVLFGLVLLPVYNFLLPGIVDFIYPFASGASTFLRLILVSGFIFPIGFLLGAFFPIGFLISGKIEPRLDMSWLYAVDIVGSIVGILVGFCLPIKIGYSRSVSYLSYLFFLQIIIALFLHKFAGNQGKLQKSFECIS
ncbi:MAG: hypothetical protein JW869_00625 [Candidatus Omnitrophica bacterium]|nr:hypothetical protein [Candidatus Omnitrophota bacterium]